MKANTWDSLWRDNRRTNFWTKPEPAFNDLIPMLKKERIYRALDLGCGIGRHAILLSQEGFETFAIDSSKEAIKQCRSSLNAAKLYATVQYGDIQSLPYSGGFFDFVLSWNVIYHTTRKGMEVIIAEIKRVLRSDGLLYITLNSTRNTNCGIGREVEPNTFDNPDKVDGQHLHHYSDRADVLNLLHQFRIESISESEQGPPDDKIPGTWHWTILARKQKKEKP